MNRFGHQRALEVQRQLSASGRHSGPSLVDALVAAVAGSRSLTILHYDSDIDLIATATGQPTEWVVERGRVDSTHRLNAREPQSSQLDMRAAL